jgi:8-oxo-dGTP pyrophosphatase MutT (NUDIX family)
MVRLFRGLPLHTRRLLVRWRTPNYTLGAVVLLRDERDRLLLVRQPPGAAWSLPGGLLDHGETPVAAAIRELAEETGVRVGRRDLTPMSPNALVFTASQQVDLVFTATVPAATPLRVDDVEIAEARWFSPDALPATTVATQRLLGAFGWAA